MPDLKVAPSPSDVSDQEKVRVLLVLSRHARDKDELGVFVQMLGLVDA